MSDAPNLLRAIADAMDRASALRAQLATVERELRDAIGAAGPLGQALAPLLLDRGATPWQPAAPAVAAPNDQDGRFAAFVAAIDNVHPSQAELPTAATSSCPLAAMTTGAGADDAAVDLNTPTTLYGLAELIGVSPRVVYNAEKLGALPSTSLIKMGAGLRPRVIPRLCLQGWRPAKAAARIAELLGETT